MPLRTPPEIHPIGCTCGDCRFTRAFPPRLTHRRAPAGAVRPIVLASAAAALLAIVLTLAAI